MAQQAGSFRSFADVYCVYMTTPSSGKQSGSRQKGRAVLVGLVVALLVAVPVVPITGYIFILGSAGGNSSWGLGPSTSNTAWWAPLSTIGAPVLGLLVIIFAGALAGRHVFKGK